MCLFTYITVGRSVQTSVVDQAALESNIDSIKAVQAASGLVLCRARFDDWINKYLHMYIHMYIYICIYIYTYVYVYICI